MHVCVCVSLTSDLYSGHVGRVCACACVYVCFPRQGLYICICVSLTGDLSLCHVFQYIGSEGTDKTSSSSLGTSKALSLSSFFEHTLVIR